MVDTETRANRKARDRRFHGRRVVRGDAIATGSIIAAVLAARSRATSAWRVDRKTQEISTGSHCGRWMGNEMTYVDKYSNETRLGPSMAVVKARMQVATRRGGCKCGKLKDPTEIKRAGSRTWISCHRCLGQIKQLS